MSPVGYILNDAGYNHNHLPKDWVKYDKFPKKTKEMTVKEYSEICSNYWKSYRETGLKDPQKWTNIRKPKDFSKDEVKNIVEDSILKKINQKELSEKYETSVFYIRAILEKEGFFQIPKDWTKSDLPLQPENISNEEYLKTIIEEMIKINSRVNILQSKKYLEPRVQNLKSRIEIFLYKRCWEKIGLLKISTQIRYLLKIHFLYPVFSRAVSSKMTTYCTWSPGVNIS